MRGSYIAHFTNVSMRFTTSGGLFRAAYYGAIRSQAAYNHEIVTALLTIYNVVSTKLSRNF
jgi:hypothetical protein